MSNQKDFYFKEGVKNMNKKVVSMILVLSMIFSMSVPAFANTDEDLVNNTNEIIENVENFENNENIEENLNDFDNKDDLKNSENEENLDNSENEENSDNFENDENLNNSENKENLNNSEEVDLEKKDSTYDIIPDIEIKTPELELDVKQEMTTFGLPTTFSLDVPIVAEGNAPYVFLYETGDLIFTDDPNSDTNKGEVLVSSGDVNTIEYSEENKPVWYLQAKNIRKVTFATEVTPTSLAYWFAGCESLSEIVGTEKLITENVTDMSYLFYQCYALTEIDLSHFNTSKVTNMAHMFDSMSAIESIDVSSFDTSNVINMEGMFRGLAIIQEININSLNTKNVRNFDNFMEGNHSLRYIDLSNISTISAISTYQMFQNCIILEEIKLGTSFAFVNGGLPYQNNENIPSANGYWYNKNNVNEKYGNNSIPKNVEITLVAYAPIILTLDCLNGEEFKLVYKSGEIIGNLPIPKDKSDKFLRWGFVGLNEDDIITSSMYKCAMYNDDTTCRAVMYDSGMLILQKGNDIYSEYGNIVDYWDDIEIEGTKEKPLYNDDRFTKVLNFNNTVFEYTLSGDYCGWQKYFLGFREVIDMYFPNEPRKRFAREAGPVLYFGDNYVIPKSIYIMDVIKPKSMKNWFESFSIGIERKYENGKYNSYSFGCSYQGIEIRGFENINIEDCKNFNYTFSDISYTDGNDSVKYFSKGKMSTCLSHNLEGFSSSFLENINSNTKMFSYTFVGLIFDNPILDLSSWKMLNLTNTEYAFAGTNIAEIDLSDWNVKNLKNTNHMFWKCENLKSIDIHSWLDFEPVYASYMFADCQNLEILNVTGMNLSSLHVNTSYNYYGPRCFDIDSPFKNCISKKIILDNVIMPNQNVSYSGRKYTTVAQMFMGVKTDVIDLRTVNWGADEYQYAYEMFRNSGVKKVFLGNHNLKSFICTFADCPFLEEIDWGHRTVADDIYGIFFGDVKNLKKLNLADEFIVDSASASLQGGVEVGISGLNGLQELRVSPNNYQSSKIKYPIPSSEKIDGADGYWYDTKGNKYAPNEIPNYTANVYYAITPRTVTFDPDNGDEVVSFKVPYMGTIDSSKVNRPSKEGYTFMGWGTRDGALWNFTDPVTENMTLKAVYIANITYCAIQYSDGTIVFQQGEEEDSSHGIVVQKVTDITTNVLTSSPWTVDPTAVTTVIFKDNLIPKTTAYWFAGLSNLITLENMQNLNNAETENEKAMLESYVLTDTTSMFDGCSSLTELDLSTMNMSKVDNMDNMFNGCSSLNKVTFGPTFEFKGSNSYLPVNGDDNLWYTGEEYTEYTSATIPERTVGTYVTDCPKYTVHFDTGEGTVIEDQIIKSHRTITKPFNPSATGYTFRYWTLADDVNQTEFDWRTKVTSDMTLKAVYIPSNNIRYAVKAYTQNVDNDEYSEYMSVTTGLVGTAGEKVTYSIEAPIGMHLNIETSNVVDNIKGDGSLVLNFYFDRDLFVVAFDSKGGNEVENLENIKYGKSEILPIPNRVGYTFTGWVTSTGSPVASPLTVEKNYSLTATWSANTTTKYVVETYLQNVTCDDYTMSSQEYTGTTDANVIVNGATPYGFTLNDDLSTMSGAVVGDGSLVLKLYFDRKGYSVVFDTAGGSDVDNLSNIPYETEKNVISPAKTGYTFVYWVDENDVHYTFPMQILKDLQLSAVYTPNTNTSYKVITYLEDVETDEYIRDSEVEKFGTTDEDVTITAEKIEGFTLNTDNSSDLTQTIDAEGTTEFVLKYDRNVYSVKVQIDDSVIETLSVKYGGKIVEPEAPEAPEGYEFIGWVVNDVDYDFDTPVTSDIVLNAEFEACDGVVYTVKHIFVQIDGTDGEPIVETKYGVADTQITVMPKVQKGFTPNKDSQIITIAADGSTVVEFKYNRNKVVVIADNGVDTPTEIEVIYGDVIDTTKLPNVPTKDGYTFDSWVDENGKEIDFTKPIEDSITITPKYSAETSPFKVYHYLENLEGGYADAIVENYSGTTGATITIPAKKDLNGFTATKDSEVLAVKGDGTSFVSFYYNRNEYSVEIEDAEGNKTTQTIKYEGKASEPEVSKDGYTHVGWKDTDRNTFTFDTPITKNIVLTPVFEANGDTPYTVEHYLQNVTQDGYEKKDVENKTGATDSTATAMAKEYKGFVENVEYSDRVETGIITADGKLVLKLFYDRKIMKVTIKNDDGEDKIIEVPYGGTLDEDDLVEPEKEGYTFDSWYVGDDKFDPTKPIEDNIELVPKFNGDMIKVTLELNGGSLAEGILAEIEVNFGDTYEALPTPTKEGFVFEGWFNAEDIKVNLEDTVVTTEDHTLYAKWKVEDSTENNVGLITDKEDKPVPYAKVTVKQGNKLIRETMTDAYGYFSIKGIEDGYYNAVAEKNGIITTSLIQINRETEDVTKATMNENAIDSILNIKEGTKDVVVGNLDKLHENTDKTQLLTEEDKEVINAGGSVAFVMNVLAVTEEEIKENSAGLIVAAENDNKTISRYLQMNISKTVTQVTGEANTVGVPDLGEHLLEIHIPLLPEQQGKTGYIVYRMHEGHVFEITETPNENGAYLKIIGNDLVVFASKFSDYCLAYDKPKYTVSIDTDNGNASTTQEVLEGALVSKPENPVKNGYTFSKWVVKGTDIEFDFNTSITENIEIIAIYTKNSSGSSSSSGGSSGGNGGGSSSPDRPFDDVKKNDWFYKEVYEAYDKKLVDGESHNKFNPNGNMDRASTAHIFYQLNKVKNFKYKDVFKDVKENTKYAKDIIWANENNVMIGYGNPWFGNFGPKDSLTREQFALVLYRVYHKDSDKYDWEESMLEEAEKVSEWAREAMCWCVGKGMIKGNENGDLMPQKAVSRAEACAIVIRFVKENNKK